MKRWLTGMLIVGLLVVSLSAVAQDEDVVATGLNNPRGIFVDSDGTLYIAEAGWGGETDVEGPYGPAAAGLTSQIRAITVDGEFAVPVPELVSMDAGFGQIEGAMMVIATEDSYWVVLGMGPEEVPFEDKVVEGLLQIDRETGDIVQYLDIGTVEDTDNPDQTIETVSNPSDLAVSDDGTLYIPDASGNAMYSWTEADGLQVFATWQSPDDQAQAVPTSVDIGPDGDIYVGFLSGFPFLPGTARIERYSPDGELVETYGDLTLVTDIMVMDGGDIYAVQMADGFGDSGYNAESGSIIHITESGVEPVVEGLNYPYGFALDSDGSFLVTVDSAFGAPDTGRVIRISTGM